MFIGPHYEIIQAVTTAYTCEGQSTCINAMGKQPEAGRSIACPRRIAKTAIALIGGNAFTCDDRLARKYDNRFDIYKDTLKEAKAYGKQIRTVEVYW